MHVEVGFPDSTRIQARCKDLVVETGLPPHRGGDPEKLNPFDVLLCSLATCTAAHILCFLGDHDLQTDGAGLEVEATRNADSHLLDQVDFKIRVPADFPEKYRTAVARAARLCLVQAQLGTKPRYTMSVVAG